MLAVMFTAVTYGSPK